MAAKVTVATTWLQGCSGCHIALLDLHAGLLDLLALIDIRYSTIVDVKEVPRVDVALIEGAVGNEENEHLLKTIRERSTTLIALGTCACFGGLPGLRNLHSVEDTIDCAYRDAPNTVGGIPGDDAIPRLTPTVRPLDQVVKVDYTIPGCPPRPEAIFETLAALLQGREPVMKTRNLCEECSRTKEKMLVPQRAFVTDGVMSPHELETIDPNRCFLEQGVLCMGPATREGCEARCLEGNMPCRGCMGPTPGALEQGAKIINSLASILPAGALMFQEDIVGTGYRYSLPVSIIPQTLRGRTVS